MFCSFSQNFFNLIKKHLIILLRTVSADWFQTSFYQIICVFVHHNFLAWLFRLVFFPTSTNTISSDRISSQAQIFVFFDLLRKMSMHFLIVIVQWINFYLVIVNCGSNFSSTNWSKGVNLSGCFNTQSYICNDNYTVPPLKFSLNIYSISHLYNHEL